MGTRYQAVLFDLFGTLVESFSMAEYKQVLAGMAAELAVPAEDFIPLWLDDCFTPRMTGQLLTVPEQICWVCGRLGVVPPVGGVAAATAVRLELTKRALTSPRPGAVELLGDLRRRGLRLGLVSDCSEEVPALWGQTPFADAFDALVFSCQVGIRKPAPAIYHHACKLLGVQPAECLYVGDGSSRELTGATALGMQALRIEVSQDDPHQVDVDDYTGPAIATLGEVRRWIGEGT